MARILIVDHAASIRAILQDILTSAGHEMVGEAENGALGIEKYKKLHPDLVLVSIIMPEMDGIETVRQIKKFDPTASCIMCSAVGQESMVFGAILEGAADFIIKPLQANRVVNTITRVLECEVQNEAKK